MTTAASSTQGSSTQDCSTQSAGGPAIRRLLGALGLSAAGGAALWLGGTYLAGLLQTSGATTGIDALITATILGAGLILGAWYTLSALVTACCLGARLTGLVWAGGETWVRRQGAPAMRRLLGGSAGAVLLAGSMLSPAYAGNTEDLAGAEPSTVPLTWAPTSGSGAGDEGDEQAPPDQTSPEQPPPEQAPPEQGPPEQAPSDEAPTEPDRPEESSAEDNRTEPTTAQPTPTSDDTASSRPSGERVLVKPGDTLWSIAADDLGPNTTEAQIAELWPRWYRVNAEIISDPDLIHPGQELTAPEGSTS